MGKLVRILIPLAALSAGAGCNGDVSPEARLLLEAAGDAYRAGDNQQAVQKTDAFLKDNSRSRQAGEAYYYRGRARLALGDRAGAAADLNQAAASAQDKAIQADSLLVLGNLALDAGDASSAERLYRQSLEKDEAGRKPSDETLYRLGCLLQKQGRWQEADLQFDRLIYFFDGTDLAAQAGRKVRSTAWTIRTGTYAARADAQQAGAALGLAGPLAAATREVLEDGRLMFAVQAGRFATYDQASAALPGVRARAKDAEVAETR